MLRGMTSSTVQVGLHVVDAIVKTNEVIAAGRMDGDTMLLHTKLAIQRGAVDCLVKCNDNHLGQSFANHLKIVLSP